MFCRKKDGKVQYFKISEFSELGVQAVFSSRLGGVSKGLYRSLNMAYIPGDSEENVIKNRKIFADILNIDYNKMIAGEQVHGDKIKIVNKKNVLQKRGNDVYFGGVDGLITDQKISLTAFFADCVPLFFMVPHKNVIAIAHAGWKGTLLKIGKKTLQNIKNEFGVKINNCWAGIGPSISGKNYEVGENVVSQFKKHFNDYDKFITQKNKRKFYLDLKKANQLVLKRAGIPVEQIITSELCTYENEKYFYSYRRSKNRRTGRMAAIITLN